MTIIKDTPYESGLKKLNGVGILTDEEKAAIRERGMPFRYPSSPMQDTYGQSVCVSGDCFGLGD